MEYPADKQVLVTSDLLMEGIHFDLTYVPMKHLGYKAAMVNLSDIYAMNGTPRQMVVSIALGKRFCVEDMEAFYDGLKMACEAHEVDIVGGDTTSSRYGAGHQHYLHRGSRQRQSGLSQRSQRNRLDLCQRRFRSSLHGIAVARTRKSRFSTNSCRKHTGTEKTKTAERLYEAQPDFSGKEYLLERQLKPEARRDIVQALATANIRPTSMIDISDGLSSELLHICTQSGVGCRIYEEHIPLDYQTAVMAEELNMNVTTCALNGGEDYELLFTVPIADHEKVSQIKDIKIIGHITKAELGYALISRDGQEFELKAQGWNPL